MSKIQLRQAAKHYKELPHQMAAWDWLQAKVGAEDLSEFAELYRADPAVKPEVVEPTWAGVTACAKAVGSKWPELVGAQWAIESGWGKAMPGNNAFGLKGPGQTFTTTEVVDGKTVTITDEFLTFPSLKACIVYLVDRWYRDFDANGTKYKGVNNAPSREEAARELVRQGYCTDPNYADKCIALMNQQVPKTKPTLHQDGILLNVPYYSQRDSQVAGQAHRMCFSSSCAMLAAYLKPGVLKGANADDAYLKTVQRFGDSTESTAQIAALKEYGIKARFVTNCTFEQIEAQLRKDIPVPIGVLHHGHVSQPTGGGHWLTVIGISANGGAMLVNDPYGEMDVVNGGYMSSKGARLAYSKKNLGARWLIEGPASGWAILAER